ncbi:hypothetical protein Fmac_015341 [Flemingia macrophylla]|uniref:Uncharacterized protein n=1 Tax=Flemingia macrophylla TaxID=520843 RepID=A0ABD1MF68_9FABA
MTTILVSVHLRCNLEWMSILRLMLQTSITDHHSSRDKALDREDGSQLLALEGMVDALVNLVTQLTANQKPAFVARICGIRSSNDHHTSVCPSLQQSGVVDARNDAIVIRGVQDVAADTSAETRKLEGKLDALVNLVTQLAANQKLASLVRVYHHRSRDKELDREDGSQLLKLEGKLDALGNIVTQLVANQKPASIVRVNDIRSSNDHHTSFTARNDAIVIRGVHNVAVDTYAETKKLEGKLDALVNFVTQLAANQKPASVARVCCIRSSNDHHIKVCASSQQSGVDKPHEAYATNTYSTPPQQGVHDVAADTSAETRKLEGKLDALVNLVTQLVADQKPASIARVCSIRSSNDHHTSVYPSSQQSGVDKPPEANAANAYSRPPQQGVHEVAADTSAKTRKLEGKLDAIVNLVTQLAANQEPASVAKTTTAAEPRHLIEKMSPNSYKFSARNDVIVIRGVHDVATDTSAESRRLEGKLDALVNLVTQLAANQKPAIVARVCSIRSSNDHDTSVCSSTQQSGVDEHPEAFDANTYRVHDVATDTSAETRKLEGKLDALMNSFNAGNDSIVIRGVNGVATDTSAETRKLEGKLDALVNLVTQLAVNQKPTSVARVCGIRSSNDHHSSVCPFSKQSGVDEHPEAYAINTYSRPPQQDASAETRKLEGNLDALLNLVTQLAANLKPASIARDCDILSYKDHHTSICPSSQHSGVDENPEAYAPNTYSRSPQQQRQGYTSAETRKLEDKLYALVNLVTRLYVNQKPASVARVCDIRSSNDHHTSVCPSSQQSGFSARNDAIVTRGVHVVATDTSVKTRKLEGKLDALVNLVNQLAANQKPASVARVCGIRSFNDHHTRVCHSLQQFGFSARNDVIVIRGVHDVATDTSAETRKLEGKLDALVNLVVATDTSAKTRKLEGRLEALVNLVTQLAANQKSASLTRVSDIHSFNDHHTSVCTSSQHSRVDEHPEAYEVHVVATDTSAKTRKLEGKLDALLNLVTQLAANQKPASVARVCDIRSFNDHHTSVCPSSQQSGVDEHPEAYFSARNDAIVIRGVHDAATDTSAQTRKLEGKLDALVNLVSQLSTNQKPASVARVFGIHSSNHHHTRVCPSSQQSRVDEYREAYAVIIYSRPPQ